MSFLCDFSIQAGSPELTGHFDKHDELDEAITRTFEFPTEHIIIFWKDCYIPICYKYEFQTMIYDLLSLLEAIASTDEGHKRVVWSPDTFHSYWTVDWESSKLSIHAEWDTVGGQCHERLVLIPTLGLQKEQFLCEWRRPLTVVLDGLMGAGHSENSLPELTFLKRVISMIPGDGVHYSTFRKL